MQPGGDERPLAGLKVLDFSRLLPGAYATLVMADWGAQVDKVEDPNGGDPLRQYWPFFGDESAYFYALNRNKRSLALDLKRPEAAQVIQTLVHSYDVLVESFRPGVMERLGLSYPALAAHQPKLIYCSITGFGQTGPDRQRPGHDLGFLARSGVLGTTGAAGGPPVMSGAQFADIGGGSLMALSGVLGALYARERTGRGRQVDISITEGSLAFLHMTLGAQLLTGGQPPMEKGVGPLNGGYPCYGVYATKDGRALAVGALEPKFFAGVCDVLGLPELAEHGWTQGDEGQRVRGALAEAFAREPLSVWMERFRGREVCVEPVLEVSEVLGDALHVARRIVVEETAGAESSIKHLRTPLSAHDSLVRRAPPGLGAHSEEILRESGVGDAEISRLLAKP